MDKIQLVEWRKARRSVGNGACIEIAVLDGTIGVRDSKIAESPVLSYSSQVWRRFVRQAKNGQADVL